jgi:hypothetical protein
MEANLVVLRNPVCLSRIQTKTNTLKVAAVLFAIFTGSETAGDRAKYNYQEIELDIELDGCAIQ